ncbi:MAG: hypothetical protein NTU79_12375 [Planctomycetota bacterium]|nr:hypothetical protein [Planctomycetota bacterium]
MHALRMRIGLALIAAIAAMCDESASAEPVIPGLFSKHPLTKVQVGELLIGELRCAACHAGLRQSVVSERTAPELANVGGRVNPEYLKRFLSSPEAAHPGTTMPDLLASETPARRDQIAEALTHFLVAQSSSKFQADEIESKESTNGKELFHSVGCVACHAPRDDADKETTHEGVVSLGHLPSKYHRKSLGDFLYQPLRVRSSGRMPDMKLTLDESSAIAGYLLKESNESSKQLETQDKLVSEGKKYFQELNCAACHKLGDNSAAEKHSLSTADATRGCLSKTPSKSPQFNLDEAQTNAIREALSSKTQDDSDKTRIALSLTAFNCIACHIREDYGGVSEERNTHFQTSEKNIGDDGRIPPPLTLVGAKLQPVWMKKVLFDGESVRYYMFTRMPQYGERNLQDLPECLGRIDILPSVDLKIPNPESQSKGEREREKVLRTAGRELLGDKGVYCVACHSFNGKPSPINQGIDLMTTYQRLQPGWFNEFVRNPGKYRPRIVMPFSWPGGVASHTTILDGNTDQQIEAIWYYLSLGRSAADPSGIRGQESKLTVTDSTRTYRGRSNVAGFRGIAVGFPEHLNYAFNAETGTLTSLWQGDYIRVDRSGQGSGSFNPASKLVPLHQDVSFAELPDETTPWPLRPVMTKEQPVNQDPLYPKSLGYQFKGYFMDDAAIPTFMYRFGEIEVQDRSVAVALGDKWVLERTIQFTSPRDQTVWFRALVGELEAESKREFKTPNLRITIPVAETLVRSSAKDSPASELLLKLSIPRNKSTLTFTYELLAK